MAGHSGQFTAGGYLSAAKHNCVSVDRTHNLPIVSPTRYQLCYRNHHYIKTVACSNDALFSHFLSISDDDNAAHLCSAGVTDDTLSVYILNVFLGSWRLFSTYYRKVDFDPQPSCWLHRLPVTSDVFGWLFLACDGVISSPSVLSVCPAFSTIARKISKSLIVTVAN